MSDRIKSLCESINDLQINWYDNFNKLINILKQECRILNKINNEVKNSLFKRVSELDGLDMEEAREEKEVIKNEMEDFYKKQREGNEKRVCDIRMSFYKHPTKVLIENESNNNKKCAIEKFKRKNGSDFICNGPIEQIKRGTLYRQYENGGLSMMCLRARLKTIIFQNFVHNIEKKENRDRECAQFCIYWLKWSMRDYMSNNLNTIPQVRENLRLRLDEPNLTQVKTRENLLPKFGKRFGSFREKVDAPTVAS